MNFWKTAIKSTQANFGESRLESLAPINLNAGLTSIQGVLARGMNWIKLQRQFKFDLSANEFQLKLAVDFIPFSFIAGLLID